MNQRTLRLLVFLSVFSTLAFAQEISVRRLDMPAEIKTLEIFCTFPDSEGLVWIGTNNGIYSYDGYEYRHYENPIENDFSINAICEVEGKLWLGAWRNAGIWQFDKKTGRFTRMEELPVFQAVTKNLFCVRSFQRDGSMLWFIGTYNSRHRSVLVGYDLESKKITTHFFNNPPGIAVMEFNSLALTKNGDQTTFWIATQSTGVFEFDPDSKRYAIHTSSDKRPGSLSYYDVRYVYASPSEPALWVSTASGLDKLDLHTRRVTKRYTFDKNNPNSLSDKHMWAVIEVDRKLWAGTENGLNCIDMATNQVTRFKHDTKNPASLSGNFTWGLSYYQGLLWISTMTDGISQINLQPSNFVHIPFDPDKPGGLTGNSVLQLRPGRSNGRAGMWVLTENALFFHDSQRGSMEKHIGYGPDMSQLYFTSMAANRHDVWLATEQGLRRYDIRRRQLKKGPPASPICDSLSWDTRFYNSFPDDSTCLWIGSWEHGLTQMNLATGQLKKFTPGIIGTGTAKTTDMALFPTPLIVNGRRYIYYLSSVPYATTKQSILHCLVRFEPATNEYTYYTPNVSNSNSLATGHLISLEAVGDSLLWIGTHKGGLEKFDARTGHFTHYTARQGIKSTSIFATITDAQDNVWMCTSTGISRLATTGRVTHYRGPFMEGQFWMTQMNRDERGYIYCGTSQGLIVFDPGKVRINPYPPHTAIHSFKVFDKDRTTGVGLASNTRIHLTHEDNFISFEFSALNYREPERNEYSYQLVGVDKTWSRPNNRRYVSYSNLGPGTYQFRVKSSNNDGIWNTTPTVVFLTITPPWWATWWFRVLALGLVVLSLLGLYRLRVRTLKRRQLQLERQVYLRTTEITCQKEEISLQQEQLTRMNGYLKLLSDTLEERVHDRTAELLKANQNLRRKNEEIQQALVQGQTQERKRVAAELHDNLGGLLSALRLNMEMMNTLHLTDAERKLYENVLGMVTSACTEVRNISHHMLPDALEKNGLKEALRRFVYSINTGGRLRIDFNSHGLHKRLDKAVEASLYPICIELVNNVLKHAEATEATLQIVHSSEEITIVMEDNGKGISGNGAPDGLGLRSIRARTEAMQGVCRIDSSPQSGTTVTVDIPLRKRKQEFLKSD